MFKPRVTWVVALFFWLFAQSVWVGFVEAKPDVPVIFIHGFTGSEKTWQAFDDVLHQPTNGWSFGGCPIFNKTLGQVLPFSSPPCPSSLSKGDFYRMRFSDNQNLAFDDQAIELKAIIDTVLTLTGKTQVILVGHSMGGLAARDYLQYRYQPDKVLKLITVGTPHRGVYLAAFCQNTGFCPASALNIDPYSIAVTQLRPDSMQDINNLTLHPLPTPVRYTSIIGTGKWTYDPSGG